MWRTQHDRRHQALRKSRGSDGHCTEFCVITSMEKKIKKIKKKINEKKKKEDKMNKRKEKMKKKVNAASIYRASHKPG